MSVRNVKTSTVPSPSNSAEKTKEKTKKKKVKLQLRAPTQERSRQTVSDIVNACTKIIVEEGYFGVTTEKIAKGAGVSIGSIYQFFGNKESVVSAVIVGLFDRDMAFVKEKVAQFGDISLEQRGRRMMEVALDVYNTEVELRARIQSIYQYVVDEAYYSQLMKNYHSIFAQMMPAIDGRDNQMRGYIAVHSFIGLMETIIQERKDFYSDKNLTGEIIEFFCGYFNQKS